MGSKRVLSAIKAASRQIRHGFQGHSADSAALTLVIWQAGQRVGPGRAGCIALCPIVAAFIRPHPQQVVLHLQAAA